MKNKGERKMRDDKIRVCPFCGDIPTKNIIKDSYYRDRFVIECGNCGLTMFDIAEDSLLRDWNKRVSDKEVEGLKNQIEKMNGWISVEDRLPDVETDDTNLIWYNIYCKDNTKCSSFFIDGRFMLSNHTFEEVTHWQPLPESPVTLPDQPEEKQIEE